MLRFWNALLLLVLSVSIIAGCSPEKSYKTAEQAFIAAGITSKGIIEKVELTDGAIIFYEGLNHDAGVGLARNYDGKWKWIMGAGLVNKSNEPLSISWANLDQMTREGKGYHLFWGSVNNEEINKLHVAYNNEGDLNGEATIIDSGLGFGIWYVVSTHYYGTVPGIKATGYDKEGEIVFRNY